MTEPADSVLVRYIVHDVDAALAVHGVGGDQILLDDPSGNPIELFQYTR
jgi:hypothetical protein